MRAMAGSEFDMPLSARYDETDAAILFENVKVPWDRVFLHNNVAMTREIYFRTPGHALANHQANVRFVEKTTADCCYRAQADGIQ